MFVFATVHGFTSGADNTNLAVQWVALTGGLFVFLLVTFRLLAPRRSPRARQPRRMPRARGTATAGARAARAKRATGRGRGTEDAPSRADSPALVCRLQTRQSRGRPP